ncbi:helix-turn-helix domain-containing protein [Paenarthrobacter sp. 4246]|uniref:helix-turn-helix domain-containing protein n=1 Tax=Paenarthrobacter sp. 4246 TaxID=3156456 RepID=UPI003398D47A
MSTKTISRPARADDVLRAYSLPDVAERLGVSLKTVRRMVDSGGLETFHPYRKGRTVRVSEQTLRDHFAAGVRSLMADGVWKNLSGLKSQWAAICDRR